MLQLDLTGRSHRPHHHSFHQDLLCFCFSSASRASVLFSTPRVLFSCTMAGPAASVPLQDRRHADSGTRLMTPRVRAGFLNNPLLQPAGGQSHAASTCCTAAAALMHFSRAHLMAAFQWSSPLPSTMSLSMALSRCSRAMATLCAGRVQCMRLSHVSVEGAAYR